MQTGESEKERVFVGRIKAKLVFVGRIRGILYGGEAKAEAREGPSR